jgi:lipopolysaccharide transport system permease protein
VSELLPRNWRLFECCEVLETVKKSSETSAVSVTILPRKTLWELELGEIWEHRGLLYFLAWRDIKVRYKQTALGAGWAILQPLLATLVFTVFFGRLAKMPSDGIPYPVFVYSGMVVWQFFANALSTAANSVVGSQNLIKKVYFPRLIVPLSSVLSSLVDFSISFLVFLGLLYYYRIVPNAFILLVPLFLCLALAAALSLGLWFAALNVQFRDVRYALPYLTQIWMFVTPVVYPSSLVPAKWRVLYGLNPMTSVIDGFRSGLFGKPGSLGPMLWVSVAMVIGLFFGGLLYFQQMNSTFADVV